MTADLTEAAAQPREDACRRFAEGLRRALRDLPAVPGRPVPGIGVGALGVRDAFAGTGDLPDDVLPVHLYGRQAVIGPWPAEGRAGCAVCLRRRWQGVRSVGLREGLELRGGTREAGPWPYPVPFAVQAVATLIARLAAAGPDRDAPFPDVWLMDLEDLTTRHHPLVPEPDCPRCGTPEPVTAESAALSLRPAPKYRPGVGRVRPLDDYGLRVDAFANPHWGAIGPSVVCDVTSPTTSATVGCFSSRSGDYLRETFWGGHADTYHDSTRIGVLEGLERFAGMRARGRAVTLTAALDDLGPDAVDPRETGLYTDDFHRANPWVPPFAPDRAIPWVWGWSLRNGRPRPVPEILAFYHKPGIEHRFVQESSNGCASGGSLEEAVLSGLMEALERDAFLLAWHGMQPLREIDPSTSADPRTRFMVDRMAMYGYRARFFDTRITFPVPVVTGVAERFDGGPARMCFGAGASLDPEAALAAALCEIATDSVQPAAPLRAQRGRVPRHGRRPREDHQPARPPAGLRGAGDGPSRRLPAAAVRARAALERGRPGLEPRRRLRPGRAGRPARRRGVRDVRRVRRRRRRPDHARAARPRAVHREGSGARTAAARLRLEQAAGPAHAAHAHRAA
ncbi:hypothetical protein SHIRM173S_07445 [Streptomyces hirsutus]